MIGRVVAAAAALLLLAGCGGAEATRDAAPGLTTATQSGSADGTVLSGTVNVYAAASLTATFTELGEALMADNPDLDVQLVLAGSSDLVSQLSGGAPGDVLASADQRNMTRADDADLLAGEPTSFATNHLTIAVAPGNPHQISSLVDLTDPLLNVVTCAPQVPCGGATRQVAELAGVELVPVSEENSVTSVLAKVTAGEADAGLVYRTDARSAGEDVTAVDFPEADQVTNVYPIALLADARNPQAGKEFIDLVLSEQGQEVLRRAGFNSAPTTS
ncbi:MAG: molybdate ABC transporter substrate-binding protein [Brooklawnia sp.]|uniref:molybdate ABC transporter substrate-binding protein n=1 Tax=Brooklawnia sp. TaxID=2699740 RepID=UPI003C77F644